LEASPLRDHVVICGYGRIGQNVARFLEQEGIEYVALDLDPARVREAHAAGEPVYYGDSSQREMLESAGLQRARLLVISYDDIGAALKVLHHTRSVHPDLPVLVRTRDDVDMDRLQKAGATEVVAETLEAGTMLVSHVLLLLDVPASRVVRRMRDLYRDRYRLLREFYHGEDALFDESEERFRERLHTVALAQEDHAAGRTLADLALDRMGVLVTAIRRRGIRGLAPTPDTRLQAGDVVVLYGAPEDLDRAQVRLRRGEAH
jgi:CPA2 family monovalent cation:H+ antiporter-2